MYTFRAARRHRLGWIALVVVAGAACSPSASPDRSDGRLDAPGEIEDGGAPETDDERTTGEPGEVEEGEEPSEDPTAAAAEVGANELGVVPVIMYHRVIEGGSEYNSTPEGFRAELELLFDRGYRPIRAVDLVDGNIDLPAGRSPVVLTFDDSSPSQFGLLDDGSVDPESAVGILLDVASEYSDVEPTGSLYVLSDPFASTGDIAAQKLRHLSQLGFELGNHTAGHANLGRLSPSEVRRELALGAQLIRDAVPGAQVRTLALPFGVYPDDSELALSGSYDGLDYEHDGVLLVGAGPSPSPFDTRFDPARIPRIRSQPDHFEPDAPDFGSGYWLWVLDRDPGRRYVSDGDPSTISFPSELADQLDPRYEELANPY